MTRSFDAEVWRDADRILNLLLDLPEHEQRPALDALPLSKQVLDCVIQLLDAHRRKDGPLELLAEHAGGTRGLQGRTLGVWTLGEELGRGGMAVVYAASAPGDGFERRAAVKVLTLGWLASHGAERLHTEQAILARLDHPAIVPLLDAGVSDDGTPWMAMTRVDGERIDAWCERRAASERDIVGLVLQVCDAVAHAHRYLIVHRDLKPSNVLVDSDGRVRLLDFGIARITDDTTAITASAWRVLTPQYAAPEHIAGAPASTAMDVFGLGALLYRLLAGCPPRDGIASAQATPPPSRRQPRVPRDLDAIVLRAVAEDPTQRYPTVAALSDDLQRWLRGDAVTARAPPWSDRVWRVVRRHAWAVSLGAAAAVCVVGALSMALWWAREANIEAARARMVQGYLTGLFAVADPHTSPVVSPVGAELLANGVRLARDELPDGMTKAEILLSIGAIQTRSGRFADAAQTLGQAHALAHAAGDGDALAARAALELGYLALSEQRRDDALRWLDAALAGLGEAHVWRAQRVEALLYRATAHEFLGHLDAALADEALADALERSIAPPSSRRRMLLLQTQGRTLAAAGRFREADAKLTAAAALAGTTVPDDHSMFLFMSTVADALGDWDRADALLRRGVAIARAGYPPDSLALATPLNFLAVRRTRGGQDAEAEALLREALRIRRLTTPDDSPTLAMPVANLGVVLRNLGRYEEARALLIEARGLAATDDLTGLLIDAQRVRLEAEAGRAAVATALAEQVERQAERLDASGRGHASKMLRIHAWLAIAMAQAGEPQRALHFADRSARMATSESDEAYATGVLRKAAALRALAQIAAARDGTKAVELATALEGLPAFAHSERAYAYLALAEDAVARGDPSAANGYIDAALDVPASVRMPVALEQALTAVQRAAVARDGTR